MPAVLTHKSIMLLARERIKQVRDVLQTRQNTGRALTDLEHRLLVLAKSAFDMMSGPPTPALAATDPLRRRFGDVNKFAVMGSMGPDITAFSAFLAPGQGWAFDLVHKGSPDADRELVAAGTTDLAFTLFEGAKTAISRSGRGAVDQASALKAIQGYVLGHLCHIAGDVISHPYVNDVEWHLGTSSHEKFSHAGGEGSMDALVAQKVLLRASTREGQAWDVWWPTADEVPPELFAAYADALDRVYKARTLPPANISGAFLATFRELAPPAVDAEFVRDGYRVYHDGIVGYGYGFGQWRWVATLFALLLPIVAAAPLAAALPRTSLLFRPRGAATDGEEDAAVASLLALPIALSAPVLTGYGFWALGLTHLGVEDRSIPGMISLVATTALAAFYFLDLWRDFGLPSWLRWLLFVGLPVAAATWFLVNGIRDLARGHRTPRGATTLLYAAPLVYFAFFFIFIYGFFFAGRRDNFDDSGSRAAAVTMITVFWALALFLILATSLAKSIRDAKIPEEPAEFPASNPHFVRLFDDASLFRDDAGTRFFPAAGRPLLKLWWEGGGDLHLRSRRYQLEFSFDGATVSQMVPAPLAPSTPAEYGQLLTATVKDRGGATGHLQAVVADATEPVVQLPPGAVFADHGDDVGAESVAKHAAAAGQFQKLPTNQGSAFVLRHAPKPAQASFFGAFGPAPAAAADDGSDRERREGYHYVADGSDDALGETLMDYAADFAAVLCLGAVPQLAGTAGSVDVPTLHDRRSASGAVSPAVGQVGQVFRNWSLDRRRVNEWRMMIAGGALSEKGGHPELPDPAMQRPMGATWHPDPAAADGERVANALGWVPLLRQWIGAVAAGGDPLDETVRPNGWKNRELSLALAFLFDLPRPVALEPAP